MSDSADAWHDMPDIATLACGLTLSLATVWTRISASHHHCFPQSNDIGKNKSCPLWSGHDFRSEGGEEEGFDEAAMALDGVLGDQDTPTIGKAVTPAGPVAEGFEGEIYASCRSPLRKCDP